MSAFTTNTVQSNTQEPRPLLRPLFYIIRPGNVFVPLIPADELPSWLEVVGTYTIDIERSYLASYTPHPRLGEYDIICRYCVNATEHVHDQNLWVEGGNDANQEEQGRDALMNRGYAPTAQNQYMQTFPPVPEAAPPELRPVRPMQLLLPSFSSLSLPTSLPASLPSQPSGLQQQQLASQQLAIQQPLQQHYQQQSWRQGRERSRKRWSERNQFRQQAKMPKQAIPYVQDTQQQHRLNASAQPFRPPSGNESANSLIPTT